MNQLRTQCAQALSTIATTCNCAAKLMWPYLLEFLCQERYTPAVGDLCKCLRILIQRESEAGRQMDYSTGFDNPLVAGRHAVLARLMVSLCNAPSNGLLTRRATEALGLIKAVSPWFSEHIPTAIDKQVEKMESLLEELSSTNLASPSTGGSGQPLSELRGKRIARWHEASLELLSQILTVVVDGGWRIELASAMGKQLDMYKDMPDEKAFLLRCLGTVLARITMKNFVVEHFMLMFKSTQHASTTERQGCARGVGAVAAVHTDLVLVELENVSKWEHAKKSGGFLGFIKDTMPMRQYPDAEMIYLRATLMLSYGYVVQNCPIDSLTQRLQQQILPFLRHYLSNPKQETVVREAMLETMRLIGWSVHSQRIGTEWKLDARNELLSYVKDYVQSESPEMLSSSLRLLACKATSALVQLDPPLSDNDIWDLCRILTQYIIPMYREKSGLKTLAYDLFDYATTSFNTFATSYNQQNHVKSQMRKIEDDESATIMEATVVQFGFTLEQIIRSRSTIATTTMLLKILQSYYGKTSEHERSRAVDATVLVLKVYHVHAGDVTIGHASDFPPLSSLLGRLSPRLTDSLAHVRMQSLAAIHWALKLVYLHKGHGQDYDPNLFSIDKFAHDHQLGGEGKLDGQVAKKVVKAMSEIIESYLPQSQMQTYLSALFEMLADRQSHVSSSSAQLLASSLAIRGATLHNEADTLVATLLQRLPEVHSCIQTYTDLLSALVAFAAHQQQVVCDVILKQPLPYTTYISDSWECLSRDKWLSASIIDYLMESLGTVLDNPFEVIDTGAGNSVKVVYQEVCQYAAAIAEVVKNGEPESVLVERIPQILALMLHLICSVSDNQFPVVQREDPSGKKLPLVITPDLRRLMDKPAGMGVAVIKNILNRTQTTAIYEDMNQARGWTECLDSENFIHAMTILVRSMVEQKPGWVPEMSQILESSAIDEREPKRLAAVIMASSLIKKAPFIYRRIGRVGSVGKTEKYEKEPSLCIKGLGDLYDCPHKAVQQRFITAAVDASMGGLDDLGDRKDTIAMESIMALNKLVTITKDQQLISILPQVLLKIKACFEKESSPLRSASFSLFGELGARVGDSSEQFASHLHNNLVALLLHLNDDSDDVRQSCALALYQTAPLMTADIANSVLTRELQNGKQPANYANFIKDFAMILSASFPDRINQYALCCCSYFKSQSARIRSNSALLTGCLLGDLSTQLRATISKELIFSGLTALLKDPEEVKVRIAAAKAIAQLHDFAT
ncbi:hypothetical protein WR25_08232 [Diploscapter pachys]|uniref:Uncharacterized protein n=1 Tax=Diploscapter pachys TaxID=2018661 RepID=A0A2A2LHJ8_9BILA|nr:hypothetical protein WR25_08232 [Diploscapter pachys]